MSIIKWETNFKKFPRDQRVLIAIKPEPTRSGTTKRKPKVCIGKYITKHNTWRAENRWWLNERVVAWSLLPDIEIIDAPAL